MKGDIRIPKGEAETLPELPEFLKKKSEKFRTVYILFKELLESEHFNQLLRDFQQMVGVSAAIIDLEANVLASSNWQRICTHYHRVNPDTCTRCFESDTELANQLEKGTDFTMYRCKNGLTDCASPIIIEGEHVANLFIGQFLLESADLGFFREQAETFGFPTDEYMKALGEVPVVEEGKAGAIMSFLANFAKLAASMGLEKLRAQNRTAELAEANKKLTDLDRLKTVFIASMSHELRTPLNAIIGFTGVVLQELSGELNDRQKAQLQRSQKAAAHLLALLTEVLDVAEIEGATRVAKSECFELGELLDDAVASIEEAAAKKALLVEIKLDQPLELVTDRKLLLQCVKNYLSNAVKYSERGTITLRGVDEGETVFVSVTDTGIGIDSRDIAKIFEPFERLDSHLKVFAGGTGLGLYIVKRIVETLLGGEVYVKSEPGVGSTFGIRIPRELNAGARESLYGS